MREILFRGKRLDNGEWVEGYFYHDQQFINGNPCQDIFIIRDEIDQDFHVNPATVGQYTGLLDKNGKRIFEGDIIKYPTIGGPMRKSAVYWDEKWTQWCYGVGFHLREGEPTTKEVVGNIYDVRK